jgi:hypothetical protein
MAELQECIFIVIAVVESLHGFPKNHRMIFLYSESEATNLVTISYAQEVLKAGYVLCKV